MSNTATHKKKVKMARRMMTSLERKHGVPLFSSAAWGQRFASRNKGLQRKNAGGMFSGFRMNAPVEGGQPSLLKKVGNFLGGGSRQRTRQKKGV